MVRSILKGSGRPPALPLILQLPEALDVLPAQLAFELPIAQCFADDLAGRRMLAGLDSGLQCGDLFARNADFLDVTDAFPPVSETLLLRTKISMTIAPLSCPRLPRFHEIRSAAA